MSDKKPDTPEPKKVFKNGCTYYIVFEGTIVHEETISKAKHVARQFHSMEMTISDRDYTIQEVVKTLIKQTPFAGVVIINWKEI